MSVCEQRDLLRIHLILALCVVLFVLFLWVLSYCVMCVQLPWPVCVTYVFSVCRFHTLFRHHVYLSAPGSNHELNQTNPLTSLTPVLLLSSPHLSHSYHPYLCFGRR
ncbi:hypothetical protein ACLKA6_015903 [Drosophila palustris]